ncbi:hypothetical protein FQN54_004896 [Arachnomyces sp. PD_36]|nr:hypothetical protein FQN54_004896 [Arachnomyces sp. PD_36]
MDASICDERRPRCRNCVNRSLECHYPSSIMTWVGQSSPDASAVDGQMLSSNVQQNGLEPSSSRELSDPALTFALLPPSSGPMAERDRLMFQWFTSTIHTAAHDESTLVKGQKYVTGEALSHEFLMHGILAFSALHIAHTRTGEDHVTYLKAALNHHSQGLAIFRPLLRNVNACKPAVVIAFSALTMLFTFGYFQQPVVEASFSPIDDIAEVFRLARGSDKVFRETKVWKPRKKSLEKYGLRPYTPHDATSSLEHLRQINDTLTELDINHEADTYGAVIQQLQSTFEEFSVDKRNYHILLSWAVELPDRYLTLLKERDPFALVILGHYCVLLHNLRHIWWLCGWGVNVLRAVHQSLHKSWWESVKWPLEETGLLSSTLTDGYPKTSDGS